MEIVYTKISELKRYENNARTHSKEQIAEIADGIKSFGFLDPIEIDQNNTIISGHARLEAALNLGLDEVPTIIHEHLTDAQRKAYTLAANKLALKSGWDLSLLKDEFGALKDDEIDLTLTGFTNDEIDDILNPEVLNAMGGEDESIEVTENPITRLGDIWILGDHRLMCGDSTIYDQVNELMWTHTPNLMVTDPPYGVDLDQSWRDEALGDKKFAKGNKETIVNDDRADWKDSYSLFTGDIVYIWHCDRFTDLIKNSLEDLNFQIRQMIIWNKTILIMGRNAYQYKHELCWYAVKKGKTANWRGDRKQTTVWDMASPNRLMSGSKEEKTSHPTQKPIECMLRPIQNHTRANDYVYDPFGGSGTTLIACEKIGRRCLMMEILPKYCDMIIKRWQKLTGKLATLEATGELFDDGRG
jgi:DNA modification methylase